MIHSTTTFTTLVPGQLTVCTYGGFAPVCYKNPLGQLVGLDISFLTRFAESLGITMVAIEKPFENIWELPGQNECDISAAGIQQRDERPIGIDAAWSNSYFCVERSLLVRTADKAIFDNHETVADKIIIVTRGSTAHIDAVIRYPNCKSKIQFVDVIAKGKKDAQEYIVNELIKNHYADAFGEGDVSNQYLRNRYNNTVEGGLLLADVHPIEGGTETFNFVVRKASTGILDLLNIFIEKNKKCYAAKN
ncbi:substrate-binding periplasmic protein [Undibacterium flavidum]|uniref:Transporter substrate-binding domain-containing protein n=1 Tax=Undibacterium flavidum TaxID=2762297 RepID=A0ABR6YHR3_9BURK|nr:transporter substrate-binding domain-containing protein [Undibacterium flavidum]MBC3876073.1 transporter substrate-binding domain-containing protein [Undibacterium flavidum]